MAGYQTAWLDEFQKDEYQTEVHQKAERQTGEVQTDVRSAAGRWARRACSR